MEQQDSEAGPSLTTNRQLNELKRAPIVPPSCPNRWFEQIAASDFTTITCGVFWFKTCENSKWNKAPY